MMMTQHILDTLIYPNIHTTLPKYVIVSWKLNFMNVGYYYHPRL